MSQFRLIDRGELAWPGAAPSGPDTPPDSAPRAAPEPAPDPALDLALDPALEAVLVRPHRLPSFARDHCFHHGEPRLARALRPLQGKFSVVNPTVVAPLPPLAGERLRQLMRAWSEAGRPVTGPPPAGSDPPHRGAPWCGRPRVIALHEPVQPRVSHEARGTAASTMPGRDIFFWAELRYRVVVGGPEAADPTLAGEAGPVAGPAIQWFHVPLLVPDADALRQMTPATAHFYRHVTGRLGDSSTDCYWYLAAWERFHEEGHLIGHVSPSLVEHGHVGGAVAARSAASEPRRPTDEELLFGDADAFVPPRFAPYSPTFDRRGFVPPGYCLIHYFATVELAVAGRALRDAAA